MTDAASMLASSKASVRKEREGRQGREENRITIFAPFASFTDKLPSRAISNG